MIRKIKREMNRRAAALGLAMSMTFAAPAMADPIQNELPTGGEVRIGDATIGVTGNTMDINQTTNNVLIDWNTFNVGQENTVNFYQPNVDAVAVNRVLSNNPSEIYGNINSIVNNEMGEMIGRANVTLINPYGVNVYNGAQIDAGSFIASTHDLSVDDYKKLFPEAVDAQGNITCNTYVYQKDVSTYERDERTYWKEETTTGNVDKYYVDGVVLVDDLLFNDINHNGSALFKAVRVGLYNGKKVYYVLPDQFDWLTNIFHKKDKVKVEDLGYASNWEKVVDKTWWIFDIEWHWEHNDYAVSKIGTKVTETVPTGTYWRQISATEYVGHENDNGYKLEGAVVPVTDPADIAAGKFTSKHTKYENVDANDKETIDKIIKGTAGNGYRKIGGEPTTLTTMAPGAGAINNGGNINAQKLVALVARDITNTGTITAQNVSMGKALSFNLDSTGKINVVANGDTIANRVYNSGTITANGGTIVMAAKDAQALASYNVADTGVIQAGSLQNIDGKVELVADAADIQVLGYVSAKDANVKATGGNITVRNMLEATQNVNLTGDKVNMTDSASVKANALNVNATASSIEVANDATPYDESASKISATALGKSLGQSANVTLNSKATESVGDIRFIDAVTKTADDASTLTLNANRNVQIANSLKSTAGALNLSFVTGKDADQGGATLIEGDIETKGGSLTTNGHTYIGLSGSEAEGTDRSVITSGGKIELGGDVVLATGESVHLNAGSGDVEIKGDVNSGNAYYYKSFNGTNNVNWGNAKAAANDAGGHLATITSDIENAAVNGTMAGVKQGNALSQGSSAYTAGSATDWKDKGDGTVSRDWYWAAGAENDVLIQTDTRAASVTAGKKDGVELKDVYTNWSVNEANGEVLSGNSNAQNHIVANYDEKKYSAASPGKWDDNGDGQGAVTGYVVEKELGATSLDINANNVKVGNIGVEKTVAATKIDGNTVNIVTAAGVNNVTLAATGNIETNSIVAAGFVDADRNQATGNITVNGNVDAGTYARLRTAGSIQTGDVVAGTDFVDINGTTGIAVGSVSAANAATLTANNGNVIMGGGLTAGNDVTIVGNSINAEGHNITSSDGSIYAYKHNNVKADTLKAENITAGKNVTIKADAANLSGDIISTGEGNITVDGTITATDAEFMISAGQNGDVDIDDVNAKKLNVIGNNIKAENVNADGYAWLSAAKGNVEVNKVSSTDYVTLSANKGTVTVKGVNLDEDENAVKANSSVAATGKSVDINGDVDSGNTIQIRSNYGNITTGNLKAANNVVVDSKHRITAAGVNAGGKVDMDAKSVITVTGKTSGNTVDLNSSDSSIFVHDIEAVGNVNVQADYNVYTYSEGNPDTVVKAGGDISLKSRNVMGVKTVTSENGAVNMESTGSFIAAGDVTAKNDVTMSGKQIQKAGRVESQAGNVNLTANDADRVVVHSDGTTQTFAAVNVDTIKADKKVNINAGKGTIVVKGTDAITAGDDVTATGKTMTIKGKIDSGAAVNLTALNGSVVTNDIDAAKAVTIKATGNADKKVGDITKGDITLNGAVSAGEGINAEAKNGNLTAKKALTAKNGNVELTDKSGWINIEGQVTASNDIFVYGKKINVVKTADVLDAGNKVTIKSSDYDLKVSNDPSDMTVSNIDAEVFSNTLGKAKEVELIANEFENNKGNISISSDVTKKTGGDVDLKLHASRDVEITADIKSQSGALNIEMTAAGQAYEKWQHKDANGVNKLAATIETNGGTFTANGAVQLTGDTVVNTTVLDGKGAKVDINGDITGDNALTVNAGNGAIELQKVNVKNVELSTSSNVDTGNITATDNVILNTAKVNFNGNNIIAKNGNFELTGEIEADNSLNIVAGGTFKAGVDSLKANGWKVFLTDPDEIVSGPNSNNLAQWGTKFEDGYTSALDQYVFQNRPMITVTANDFTKQYATVSAGAGVRYSTNIEDQYTDYFTDGTLKGDDIKAQLLTGDPQLNSDGFARYAAAGDYDIDVDVTNLNSTTGYDISGVKGTVTVDDTDYRNSLENQQQNEKAAVSNAQGRGRIGHGEAALGTGVDRVLGLTEGTLSFGSVSRNGVRAVSYEVNVTPDKVNVSKSEKQGKQVVVGKANQYRSLQHRMTVNGQEANFNLAYNGAVLDVYPTDDVSKAMLQAGEATDNTEIIAEALHTSFNKMGVELEDLDGVNVHIDATEAESK